MEDNLISFYEKRLAEKNFDPEYMMLAGPYIKEYYEITEEKVVTNEFPLVFKTNTKKQELFNKFLIEVEGKTSIIPVSSNAEFDEICPRCNHSNIIHDHSISSFTCMKCGYSEHVMGDDLSYKDEQTMEKTIVYSYKRENHFNEWISQFQGTESTTIPMDVIEKLRYEFKKQRVNNLNDITHQKVRALLKKLKLNKYYEHVPYITTILNGNIPPRMTQGLEEKLRLMFSSIQQPFEQHCPQGRKNFLSYSYVLYKFCELLGEDEFLPCFPLLKSKEKLRQQDMIWKKITNTLQWEFIPTT